MLTESNLKAYCDSNQSFHLSKGSFKVATPLFAQFVKRAPLSYHESYPIKHSLNFTYENEAKSLFDTKNRNRSNPPSHKFYFITIQEKANFQKENKELLIDNIIEQRKKSAIKISSFIKGKMLDIQNRQQSLIKKILNTREKSTSLIQSVFKGYKIKKDLKNITLCDLVFLYDINDNMIHKLSMDKNDNIINNNVNGTKHRLIDIKLCLYNHDKKGKEVSFNYSTSLKRYYLPLLKRGVIKKKYRVNFIVNGQTIIDPRYEVDNDEKGNFYNIISKSMLIDFKKKEVKMPKPPTRKYWESIFKMKSKNLRHSNSCDSLSVSNNTELSNEHYLTTTVPNNTYESIKTTNIKPILKNILYKSESFSSKRQTHASSHHVKFNTTIQYSY